MIQKKICILGSFAVGKTSLVQRFVKGIFSKKYLTTLGVKIDKKVVHVNGKDIEFILWDLAGEDEFMKVRQSYLKGAAGYLLVTDGTRAETLETALLLHQKMAHEAESLPESLPFVLLINKSDLKQQWNIDHWQLNQLQAAGWHIIETSAKHNKGVEESFYTLASSIIQDKVE